MPYVGGRDGWAPNRGKRDPGDLRDEIADRFAQAREAATFSLQEMNAAPKETEKLTREAANQQLVDLLEEQINDQLKMAYILGLNGEDIDAALTDADEDELREALDRAHEQGWNNEPFAWDPEFDADTWRLPSEEEIGTWQSKVDLLKSYLDTASEHEPMYATREKQEPVPDGMRPAAAFMDFHDDGSPITGRDLRQMARLQRDGEAAREVGRDGGDASPGQQAAWDAAGVRDAWGGVVDGG